MGYKKNFKINLLFLSIATILFSAAYVNADDYENIRNTVKALDCTAAGKDVEVQSSKEAVAGEAEIKEIEMKVLDLINDERERQNLPWLSWNDQLFQVARDHSEEMAMMNEYRNTDGCTFGDRLRGMGYDWSTASEVIVSGEATAQELFSTLMKSESRRAEISSASYFDIGIGHVVDERSDHVLHYWTLNLGTQRSVSGDSHADLTMTNGGYFIDPSSMQFFIITGGVLNRKGENIKGATVSLCNQNKKVLNRDMTNKKGGFLFMAPGAARYLIHVQKRGYRSIYMWFIVTKKNRIVSKTVVLSPR